MDRFLYLFTISYHPTYCKNMAFFVKIVIMVVVTIKWVMDMLKHEILNALKQQEGVSISGGQLGKQFHVSRTAVWKAINALKEEGYEIVSYKNSGYELKQKGDVLDEGEIRRKVKAAKFGNVIHVLGSVPSTNRYIKEMNRDQLCHGLVVVAKQQTQGRGKRGKAFPSPWKRGIYMSVYLQMKGELDEIHLLTMMAVLAICRALDKVCKIQPQIRYQSDILLDGKKIGGILSELMLEAGVLTVEEAVLGIGLYVNENENAQEHPEGWTSIEAATGMHYDRNEIVAEILNQLEICYTLYSKKEFRSLINGYKKYWREVGQKRKIITADGVEEMEICNIDAKGRLVGRDGENKVVKISPSRLMEG
jgi:BirA family biotin operon repressor/biotin-[acetyl-CoA-carboxylase] ligase